MRRYKLELLVNDLGAPQTATITVYEDDDPVKVSTHAVEPFVSWVEVMNDLIDGLPIQLRLL